MFVTLASIINPNIDTGYWWLGLVSMLLWGRALWWNVRATRLGVAESVKLRAATSALAFAYLLATSVLLFSHIDPAAWGDIVRGLTLLSVPVVWELPARMSVRMGERLREVDRAVYDRYNGEHHN